MCYYLNVQFQGQRVKPAPCNTEGRLVKVSVLGYEERKHANVASSWSSILIKQLSCKQDECVLIEPNILPVLSLISKHVLFDTQNTLHTIKYYSDFLATSGK